MQLVGKMLKISFYFRILLYPTLSHFILLLLISVSLLECTTNAPYLIMMICLIALALGTKSTSFS